MSLLSCLEFQETEMIFKKRHSARSSEWMKKQTAENCCRATGATVGGERGSAVDQGRNLKSHCSGRAEAGRAEEEEDDMDASAAVEKMSLRGTGACLGCKGSCSGFQPHSWRKACVACGCSTVDHAPESDLEDDQRMGRLLGDSPCSHLTAKVKGGGGLRVYKRNRMIVTNPVVSRKDPTFNTTTYDWAPAGLNQKLAIQYMELLPESQRPVSGTNGALERRRQLLSQLPIYDQDPMKCQSLGSEEEVYTMILFVKKFKQEVLGVGEVALPGESAALKDAAAQRVAKEVKDRSDKTDVVQQQSATSSIASSAVNGTNDKTEYRCTGCHAMVLDDSPAVYAERAGYHEALWHPTCFACSECGHALVDLVYFCSNQKLLCGRHYCESQWPRCSGCDELIFTKSFITAKDGRTWHPQHYCCWKCGQSLDSPCQHR